jgi:Zn-dependent oligopeptidase
MNAVEYEVDCVGISHMLIMHTDPREDIQAVAAVQYEKIHKFSDDIFSDTEKYPNLYTIFKGIDPATLDPEDRARYEYFDARFTAARSTAAAETGAQAAELREQNQKYLETAKTVPRLSLGPEELEALPRDAQEQLGVVMDGDNMAVELSKPNLDYILENGGQKRGDGGRELRKRALELYDEGETGEVLENDAILERLASLRNEIASAEGKTWTERQIEKLKLNTLTKIRSFYESITKTAGKEYRAAVTTLQELATVDGVTDLQRYDLPYYEKKLLPEGLKKLTFTVESTMRGINQITESLLNVRFEEMPNAPGRTHGVRTYTVRNVDPDGTSGEVVGTIVIDPETRGGKRANAATYGVRSGLVAETPDGDEITTQLPISVVVANFKGPLTLRQVQALLHETLGHAVPGVLGRSRGPERNSGNIGADIKEILGHTCEDLMNDPAFLLDCADGKVPEDVRQDVMANLAHARKISKAIDTMRILEVATYDLGLHANERADARVLTKPIPNSGKMILRSVHMANGYEGRYLNSYGAGLLLGGYIAKRLLTGGKTTWLELRRIVEQAARPGAAEALMDFALAQERAEGAAQPAGSAVLNRP